MPKQWFAFQSVWMSQYKNCISWGTHHAINGMVYHNYGTIHNKMRNKATPICTRSSNEGPLMWCWWRLWHERPLSFMLYMTIHWETLSQLLPGIALPFCYYPKVRPGGICIVVCHTLSCPWQKFMHKRKSFWKYLHQNFTSIAYEMADILSYSLIFLTIYHFVFIQLCNVFLMSAFK